MPEQPPEVGVAPLALGALALLDDRVDRTRRGREVGHRDELLPAEVLLGRLGVRRPDEQPLGADPAREVLQADADGPVQRADRLELPRDAGRSRPRCRARRRRPARRPRSPPRPRRPCPRAARGTRSGGAPLRRTAGARSGRPPGRRTAGIGKFGRAKRGAAPTAVRRFWTSARWSISWALISSSVLRQRWIATSCSGVTPSRVSCLSENAANRYWSITRCSSSAALPSV